MSDTHTVRLPLLIKIENEERSIMQFIRANNPLGQSVATREAGYFGVVAFLGGSSR